MQGKKKLFPIHFAKTIIISFKNHKLTFSMHSFLMLIFLQFQQQKPTTHFHPTFKTHYQSANTEYYSLLLCENIIWRSKQKKVPYSTHRKHLSGKECRNGNQELKRTDGSSNLKSCTISSRRSKIFERLEIYFSHVCDIHPSFEFVSFL